MSPMSPRLLRPRSTVHPEAADWARRVRDNGGSVSASTFAAVGRFCRSIDAVSGLRAKFVRLNLFCGTGGNLNAVLVPLYRNTSASGAVLGNATDTNAGNNFISGDYNETGSAGGLLGNGGNKYLLTGIATNTLTEGDRHLSAYEVVRSGATFDTFMGSEGAAANQVQFLLGYGANAGIVQFGYGNFTPNINSSTTTTGGHWLGVNQPSANGILYKNGAQEAASTQVAAVPTSAEIYIYAINRGGSAAAHYGGRLGGYSIGAALSAAQALSFYNAMQTFQAALGRNV